MASEEEPLFDEPPVSSERHSRERIARPTRLDRVRKKLGAMLRAATSKKTQTDLFRRLVGPLILALVPFYWVVDATKRATLTTIGRDQGIFHYIAWAVSQGDVDYRDIRDVNGPLTHLIHLVMLKLGGADEHRFHVIDMIATGASFAIVGMLLPAIVARTRPRWVERLAWALAAWSVLGAQYALYIYWNQAQRESFCDWFLLPSIALQVMTPVANAKAARRRVVLIAALSTITWFCKPSFVFFTVTQLACLLFDDRIELTRRQRAVAFAIGGVVGSILPLAYLLRYGDVLAFLQITLRDVPRIYRFIWAKSSNEILGEEGPLGVATMGLAVSGVMLAFIGTRALPRRMLALALAPVVGVVVAIAQHKGFGYHFHPLTASTHMAFMVVVLMLWERFRTSPRSRPVGRYIAIAATGAYALFVASNMRMSPHTRNVWILAGGETPEKRLEKEYFDTFKTYDFSPWEIRQGAAWLASVTKPDARVQMYAMDPYLMFLAQRRSATPYIYAYDLNDDAALDGGWSNKPNWLEIQNIIAARRAHEKDMLGRLKEAPPEAFVFIDRSPLMTFNESAWDDFRYCCMESATWVASHYHAAKSFGDVHVWLRDDMPVPDQEGLP